MKILFLDIDGVLNNTPFLRANSGLCEFDPDNVLNLIYTINETNCQIVVSSSWRYMGLSGVSKVLEDVGVPKGVVIDVTPILGCSLEGRGYEIDAWLKVNEAESYAIVDDYNDMLPEQQGHFVLTRIKEGLTKTKADELINVLQQK